MTAPNNRERILPRLIHEEVKESFINYSMSVIVSRALPDVRDGLKPVHRRVLYAMNELGLVPGRPYKKSATVVGDVLGKYHPHGDSSVYDALVRMVQDFSLRYPLVDGQGNFGSVDGDPAAAYRYTEARLTRIAMEMLADIDKNTVDYAPNFDDRLQEPKVLPSAVPNLLINGSSGIAVGMATNIPPHNLGEVVNATIALIDNPDITPTELRKLVKGPDFPTGGYIYGRAGIKDYQETGRGRIVMRARAVIEEKESSNKSQIVINELPYQVNKSKLVSDIADLVRDQKLVGISALRDESDKDGMRIVVELKRDAIPRVVLNQLYKHTTMQSTFGVIMLALVPDPFTTQLVPKIMPLKEVLEHYVAHRHEVLVRRTQFDLDKALEREHILEGLKIAVDNIDAVIKLIRAAEDTPTASAQLQKRFKLSERQAEAILNLRLRQLRRLEEMEIAKERDSLVKEREELARLIESPARQRTRLKRDLAALKERYGDDRRTAIEEAAAAREIDWSAMIEKEPITVILSQRGWIRAMKGHVELDQVADLKWREGDGPFIHFHAQTTDRLALFAANGRAYTLPADKLPGARGFGEPVRLFVDLDAETEIVQLLIVRPETRLLIAASDGKGFVASGEASLAETRKGKQLVNLRGEARVAVVRPIAAGEDSVAVIGDNRKLLIFPLADLPELARGQGVTLQRYRDGGLADARTLAFAEGLSWTLGGESKRTRTETELAPWRAARGSAGRLPPTGFPRSNRFD